MKRLVLGYLLLIALLFACAVQKSHVIAQNSRPYLGWKIDFIKVENETTSPSESVLYERLELKDALIDFYRDHPGDGYRIRCIAQDYYYTCEERQY